MELIFLPFFAIFTLICFVFYVVALVNAAKTEQWIWFVLMLLIGPVAIFYLLFAYERDHHGRRTMYRRRY